MNDFRPVVEITPLANIWVMLFDSACRDDQLRTTRTVRIPADSAVIDFEVVDLAESIEGSRKYVSCRIVLRIMAGTGESIQHELAQCRFGMHYYAKGDRAQYYSMNAVKNRIHQGVSEALADALRSALEHEQFQVQQTFLSQLPTTGANAAAELQPVATATVTRLAPLTPSARRKSGDAERKSNKRFWMAAFGAPVLVVAMFLLFAGGGRKASAPQPYIGASAGNAGVDEQVRITQETLKSMGLDPGKATDVGCLVSK